MLPSSALWNMDFRYPLSEGCFTSITKAKCRLVAIIPTWLKGIFRSGVQRRMDLDCVPHPGFFDRCYSTIECWVMRRFRGHLFSLCPLQSRLGNESISIRRWTPGSSYCPTTEQHMKNNEPKGWTRTAYGRHTSWSTRPGRLTGCAKNRNWAGRLSPRSPAAPSILWQHRTYTRLKRTPR